MERNQIRTAYSCIRTWKTNTLLLEYLMAMGKMVTVLLLSLGKSSFFLFFNRVLFPRVKHRVSCNMLYLTPSNA